MGVETPKPRLSWILVSGEAGARNQRQSAYHIRVASDSSGLGKGLGDLWDSGEVESDETLLIDYGGSALKSRQICYWSVRARDQSGEWSSWSTPGRWTMGLVGPWDPAARWIGSGESFERGADDPPPDNAPPDPWFRKEVVLSGRPVRATACVASVGFHELWVNGSKVGDALLVPGVTDNSKRARYLMYEIGDRLHRGTNVLALWLGTGWSIYPKFATPDKPRAPIVLGQFDMDLARGGKRSVVTDGSWKTHRSPSSLLGVWDFRNFGGERYDARLEVPGWAAPGLDDRAWRQATEYRPNLLVSSDRVEPNQERLLGWRSGRGVTEVKPGIWRVDLGGNFAGAFRAPIEGEPGDRVEFQFSEQPGKAMTHRMRSEYVVGPSGCGEFRNRFNYSVGRWVTVTGLRRRPSLTDFEGKVVRPGYATASRFSCSDRVLGEIYRTTLETFENLSLGGYLVDCPHRERMGYGGDAHATTTTGLAHFSLGALYTQWGEDWRDAQGRGASWGPDPTGTEVPGEAGDLPYTAPTYWGGGGPAWSGFVVHLTREMWRAYSDRRFCEAMFPTIERWLAFLETRQRDGLLRRWGGEWDFLGDWLWPGAAGVNGDTQETLFFNNCYWIYNLQSAAEIAAVLGNTNQASAWLQKAEGLRQVVHEKFFDPMRQSYVNGGQAYLAIALVTGVPPPDLRDGVWRRLEEEILVTRQGHIHAGITGGSFLFKLLMESHRQDLAYTMVSQESYPSWGYMLKEGATTFWESWENNPELSYLHSSYLYVGAWFIHGVLGIQPAEPGYRRILIRPGPFNQPGLNHATGAFHSPRGVISVDWTRSGSRLQLQVGIPSNTRAEVVIPSQGSDGLSMPGDSRVLKSGLGWVQIEVGSGNHTFTSRLP